MTLRRVPTTWTLPPCPRPSYHPPDGPAATVLAATLLVGQTSLCRRLSGCSSELLLHGCATFVAIFRLLFLSLSLSFSLTPSVPASLHVCVYCIYFSSSSPSPFQSFSCCFSSSFSCPCLCSLSCTCPSYCSFFSFFSFSLCVVLCLMDGVAHPKSRRWMWRRSLQRVKPSGVEQDHPSRCTPRGGWMVRWKYMRLCQLGLSSLRHDTLISPRFSPIMSRHACFPRFWRSHHQQVRKCLHAKVFLAP